MLLPASFGWRGEEGLCHGGHIQERVVVHSGDNVGLLRVTGPGVSWFLVVFQLLDMKYV